MSYLPKLTAAGFLLAGLINLVPIVGVAGLPQLQRLYSLATLDPDLLLLLRHRAVLLGLVGALMVAAVFRPELRWAAAAVGLVSMGSFVVLIFAAASQNPSLVKIAWIDVAALVILVAAWAGDLAGKRLT